MRLLQAAIAVAAALAAAGCYDSFGPLTPGHAPTVEANIAIGDLTAMYRGSTAVIGENLTIAGRVTSSDRAGNFLYSFVIEQDGAAVEIMARQTDLHNICPVGSSVAVRLQGLAMGERLGVKCIGTPPEEYDYYPVGYIMSREEFDRCVVLTGGPQPFAIPDTDIAALDRRMCGRIVRVTGLTRVAGVVGVVADDGTEKSVWSGYNIFADADAQNRIAVYVSSYADFAAHRPPSGRVAVAGILQYGRPEGAKEDMFILKPRDEADISAY